LAQAMKLTVALNAKGFDALQFHATTVNDVVYGVFVTLIEIVIGKMGLQFSSILVEFKQFRLDTRDGGDDAIDTRDGFFL
jgi:hypothetical protein